MMQTFSTTPVQLRNRLAGLDVGRLRASKRQHGPALGIAALVAAAALGGCASQAEPTSAAAGYGQDAPYHVAGPVVPAPKANRPGIQACYGNSAGLVDECGPFARYDGP